MIAVCTSLSLGPILTGVPRRSFWEFQGTLTTTRVHWGRAATCRPGSMPSGPLSHLLQASAPLPSPPSLREALPSGPGARPPHFTKFGRRHFGTREKTQPGRWTRGSSWIPPGLTVQETPNSPTFLTAPVGYFRSGSGPTHSLPNSWQVECSRPRVQSFWNAWAQGSCWARGGHVQPGQL